MPNFTFYPSSVDIYTVSLSCLHQSHVIADTKQYILLSLVSLLCNFEEIYLYASVNTEEPHGCHWSSLQNLPFQNIQTFFFPQIFIFNEDPVQDFAQAKQVLVQIVQTIYQHESVEHQPKKDKQIIQKHKYILLQLQG